jgi:hypothetical protein
MRVSMDGGAGGEGALDEVVVSGRGWMYELGQDRGRIKRFPGLRIRVNVFPFTSLFMQISELQQYELEDVGKS